MKFKINIPPDVNKIIHTLQDNDYSAYVVGGALRDSILNRPVKDWDICTSATPEQVMQVFQNEYIIPTGLQHGTVTIMLNGIGYEVTTYRIDGEYYDGRHPDSVEFTSDIIQDLARRDFTINAMAYNDEEGLIDPFYGLTDIKYKKINCVGSAKFRLSEDALRILRAIRFAAQLGFTMTTEVSEAIHELKDNLQQISVERINSEFCKIASTDMFGAELSLYYDVFSVFIPELKDMIDFFQNHPCHVYNSLFSYTTHALNECHSKDIIVRLAVFFHDFGKPHSYQEGAAGIRYFNGHSKVGAELTNSIMRRLKFDNNTIEKVVELVRYHSFHIEENKKSIKELLNKIEVEQFMRLLEVKKTINRSQNEMCSNIVLKQICSVEKLVQEILNNNECYTLKDLAVDGNDLISIGYKSGKAIGYALNKLLMLVVNDDIKNDKYLLLQFAKIWLIDKMLIVE